MDASTIDFVTLLLMIILIDLVLAGDNAVVIGLAARNLPKEKQGTVIFWGTAGAILIRFISTFLIVWLLKIPGFLLIGGLLLIWIAYKLLVQEKEHDQIAAEAGVLKAIGTIIIADTVMGVDNMLAVAGIAADHENKWLLIILGLIISIPIMVFGSRLIITLIEKFPIVLYLGSGVLAFTAGKMILDEELLEGIVKAMSYGKWGFLALLVVAVLYLGWLKNQKKEKQQADPS
jgi:YjbE family integral membrane protein